MMADGVNRMCMALVQWSGNMKICSKQNSRNLILERDEVGLDFKQPDYTLTICCVVNRDPQLFALEMTLRSTLAAPKVKNGTARDGT